MTSIVQQTTTTTTTNPVPSGMNSTVEEPKQMDSTAIDSTTHTVEVDDNADDALISHSSFDTMELKENLLRGIVSPNSIASSVLCNPTILLYSKN